LLNIALFAALGMGVKLLLRCFEALGIGI